MYPTITERMQELTILMSNTMIVMTFIAHSTDTQSGLADVSWLDCLPSECGSASMSVIIEDSQSSRQMLLDGLKNLSG